MLNIHRRFSVDPRVQDFFCVTHFNKGSILNILESVCLYQCSKKAQNPDSWPDSWPDPWLLTWYHQYLYQTEAEEDELSHYRKREESWTDWTVILINDKSITLFSFYHDSLSSSGSLWSFWFFYFKSLWSINLLWSYLDSHDSLGSSGSVRSLGPDPTQAPQRMNLRLDVIWCALWSITATYWSQLQPLALPQIRLD